jgi:hypothetical protein
MTTDSPQCPGSTYVLFEAAVLLLVSSDSNRAMYTEEHSRWCRSVSCSSDDAAPAVNKKIVAWRPNGQMCESSSVPQRTARNASLACLPSFSSGHPAASSIEFPTAQASHPGLLAE